MFWLNRRREQLMLQREFDQLQRKFAVLSGHIIAIQNAVVPLLATLDRDKKEVVLRHLRDFVVSIGQQPEPSLPEDLASIALDIHLEDCGVMDQAIDCREGHGLVTEHRRVPQSSAGSFLTLRLRIRGTPYLAIGSRS